MRAISECVSGKGSYVVMSIHIWMVIVYLPPSPSSGGLRVLMSVTYDWLCSSLAASEHGRGRREVEGGHQGQGFRGSLSGAMRGGGGAGD